MVSNYCLFYFERKQINNTFTLFLLLKNMEKNILLFLKQSLRTKPRTMALVLSCRY